MALRTIQVDLSERNEETVRKLQLKSLALHDVRALIVAYGFPDPLEEKVRELKLNAETIIVLTENFDKVGKILRNILQNLTAFPRKLTIQECEGLKCFGLWYAGILIKECYAEILIKEGQFASPEQKYERNSDASENIAIAAKNFAKLLISAQILIEIIPILDRNNSDPSPCIQVLQDVQNTQEALIDACKDLPRNLTLSECRGLELLAFWRVRTLLEECNFELPDAKGRIQEAEKILTEAHAVIDQSGGDVEFSKTALDYIQKVKSRYPQIEEDKSNANILAKIALFFKELFIKILSCFCCYEERTTRSHHVFFQPAQEDSKREIELQRTLCRSPLS